LEIIAAFSCTYMHLRTESRANWAEILLFAGSNSGQTRRDPYNSASNHSAKKGRTFEIVQATGAHQHDTFCNDGGRGRGWRCQRAG
jgi:hypothetical protein